VGKAGTQNRAYLFQPYRLGFLSSFPSCEDEGADACFTDRVPHCVQVDQCAVMQGDAQLEVDLPTLMNVLSLIRPLASDPLLPSTPKPGPLMQVSTDTGLAG
jgi:hypothetical protein